MAHAQDAVAMGSVGDDHQCRVCGRVGNGGYVVDGFSRFGPICTETEDSCLAQMLGPQDVEELQSEMDQKGWGKWGQKLSMDVLSLIHELYPGPEPNDILTQALSRLTFRKLLPYAVVERIVDFYDV